MTVVDVALVVSVVVFANVLKKDGECRKRKNKLMHIQNLANIITLAITDEIMANAHAQPSR